MDLELEDVMSKLKNVRKKCGTVLFVFIIMLSLSMLGYAGIESETREEFKGLELYYDTNYHYATSFTPTDTKNILPYIEHRYIISSGYYYVGCRYREDSGKFTHSDYKAYFLTYPMAEPDGRLVSVPIRAGIPNQIYIKGHPTLYVGIDYMRYTFNYRN